MSVYCLYVNAGGAYTQLSPEDAADFKDTPPTTDCVESFFGLVDYVRRTNSCNLSFYATSGLACWTANRTGKWLEEDLTNQQKLIGVQLSRRKGMFYVLACIMLYNIVPLLHLCATHVRKHSARRVRGGNTGKCRSNCVKGQREGGRLEEKVA